MYFFIENGIYLAISLAVIFGIAFLFRRFRKKEEQEHGPSFDQTAMQKEYLVSKKDAIQSLIKDKVEMSWKFLYDVTEFVLSKFSENDRQSVHDVGFELFGKGMRYEHVVDLGIRYDELKSKAAAIEREKNKEQSKERSV